MKSQFLKLCSMVLIFALLLNLFPAQAIALELDETKIESSSESITSESAASEDTTSEEKPTEEYSAESATIVAENPEKRTAFTKDYKLSNGFNMSVVYPEVVHYEEDGQWKEIDNTLKASGSGTNGVYTNTAGGWNAIFPQQLTKDNRVTVVKEGYAISFGMAGEIRSNAELMSANKQATRSINTAEEMSITQMQTATARIAQKATAAELAQMEHPEIVQEKLHSRLTYEDVYSNIDIVYDLNGYQLKESIIINSYDSSLRGYQYVLETGSLTPVLNDDGSIDLFAPNTEEAIMKMPAPYMVDSAGAVSYDIAISLVPQDGNYLLTYRIPTAWLADSARVWPVVLDPVVEALSNGSNILDQFVAEYYSVNCDFGGLFCGYTPDFGKMRSFIQYVDIPALEPSDVIVCAELSLQYLAGGTNNTTIIEAHKVSNAWNSQTITWDNQPQYNEVIEDLAFVSNDNRYRWIITDVVRDWYASNNTGVMLKAPDSVESGGTNNWKKFYSIDYDSWSPSIWPYVYITYRNAAGLEDYWDYTTTSAGRAGTGYVNNSSGNLTWVHNDLGFNGNLMPVSISHIYNANESASNKFGLGYGWKTNYNQTIELSESGDAYIWTDGDGTKHTFIAGSSTDTYVDEDGLFLTLTILSGTYYLTDKYGNASNFDSLGRLTSIVNNQLIKSKITITYIGTSNRIAQITDGVGRLYKFTYDSNNLLSKIGYHGKNGSSGTEITNVQFVYSNSKPITVTYKDTLDSHFSYSGNHLVSATDVDGYKVAFAYSADTVKRIVSMKEYDGTIAGSEITIEYAHNKAKITKNDNTQIRYYNDYGNLISAQDDQGKATFNQYAKNKSTEGAEPINQLTLASQQQNTVANLLYHSSFESGNAWSKASTASFARTTAKAYMGNYSLEVTLNSAVSTISAYGATISVPASKTCTFSAYVQSATASVQLGLGTTSSAYVTSEARVTGSEWIRLEVSYTNNSTTAVSVRPLLILSTGGIAYIDCVQAELSSGASQYNLIQNGDFRTTGYWSSNVGRTAVSVPAAPQLDTYTYKMTGNPTGTQSVYQTVAVSGGTGDTLVLSGWAKGQAAPLNNEARVFGLKLTFNYTDGSTSTETVNFNITYDSPNDWQYAAGRVEAQKAFSSVKVELVYNYNMNDVYFDGIQLYKGDLGERYTYDLDGNLTSVTDILGLKTTYTYSNNDPVTIVEPSGLVTQNTYSYHNLTRSVRSDPTNGSATAWATYSYTYDVYGNQTKVSADMSGVVKETQTSYSSDKNNIATTTDELGNVTTYEYDPQTSVLLSVKYPNDTDTTKTKYTYDKMYRLVSTAATTNQGQTMSATYTYSEDLLTKIATKSTVYNFEYDAPFSQRTKVAVGSITLANYTYTNDVYRRLETIDYGNQDKVQYTYDSLGRVIKETYYENGGTTANRTITYEYDNAGALATMVDSKTGITTKYYYDAVGRSTGMYESGGGTTHRIKYAYDDLGRLHSSAETCGNATYTTTYDYYGNGQIYEIQAGNSSAEVYTYDEYERLDQWHTYHGNSSNHLILKYIHYEQPDDRSTSSRPSVLGYTTGNYSAIYNYVYDANGNIVSEKVGGKTTTYVYDSANQLIRENNQLAGKTWVWTYDDAGNIQSKKEYAYTTGTLGSSVDTVTYTYGNTNWGDLLTKYDGVSITYDNIGNPLYDGTWNYTWQQGRKLATMSGSGTTWNFTYDANGMRTKRTNGSTTYTYTYHGSQLTHMTCGSDTLHFYYDANGRPLSVMYGSATYYYVLNLQGDVVAILNSSGTQVVGYTYDAWGRLLSTTGSSAPTLGQVNPLRYRGYVYDNETCLYYVSSRYYDPEISRWINADNVIAGVGGSIQGYNMFAYCFNNPVNMSDSTGDWPEWLETTVKVASVVVAVTAVVVMVAAVSAVSAGTAAPGAVFGASVFLGAALSGINGGVANEAKGNSYANGYLGGATGGTIQAFCSKTPAGIIAGGGFGVTLGTAITDIMNNLDPDSTNSTAQEIASNAITSGGKALVTSSLTAYMGYASDLAVANGANGLMPACTFGLGESVKSFFGWLDDALVYIWE